MAGFRDKIEKFAKIFGVKINEEVYNSVVQNKGCCPCRTGRVPCPCKFAKDEIAKQGHCHCGLLTYSPP